MFPLPFFLFPFLRLRCLASLFSLNLPRQLLTSASVVQYYRCLSKYRPLSLFPVNRGTFFSPLLSNCFTLHDDTFSLAMVISSVALFASRFNFHMLKLAIQLPYVKCMSIIISHLLLLFISLHLNGTCLLSVFFSLHLQQPLFRSHVEDLAEKLRSCEVLSSERRRTNFISRWLSRFPTRSKRIDVVSRISFPLLFAVFNIFYWVTYLFRDDIKDI